jgi:hypothetical protein
VTDRIGRLLLVTLEAARVDADLPVLGALRSWLNSWRGIGDVERGMARQGFDLQLTRYDEKGWRATFYTTGMEHSITSATASAWERTPWHAVQGAGAGRAETGRGGPMMGRWGNALILKGRIPSNITIQRVEPNGRYWWQTREGSFGQTQLEGCMREEFAKRK